MPVSLRLYLEPTTTKDLADIWSAMGPPLIKADEYITVRAMVTSVDVPSRVTLDDGSGPVHATVMPSAMPLALRALGTSRAVVAVLQARREAPPLVDDLDAVGPSHGCWPAPMHVHRSIIELGEREEAKVRQRLGMEHGGLFVIAAAFATDLPHEDVLPTYATAPTLIPILQTLAGAWLRRPPGPGALTELQPVEPGVTTWHGTQVSFDVDLERVRVTLFSNDDGDTIRVERLSVVDLGIPGDPTRRGWVEVEQPELRTRYLVEGLARLQARRERESALEIAGAKPAEIRHQPGHDDARRLRAFATRLRRLLREDPEIWAEERELPAALDRAAARVEG